MTANSFPYRKQETDFYCGPAIVQMILSTVGVELSQSEIAGSLGTNEVTGTTIDAIGDFLRMSGFDVVRRNGANLKDVTHALQTNALVIVGYVEPEEDVPHYSLIKELNAEEIILIDPWFGDEQAMAPDEFEMRWRDDSAGAYGERMMMSVSIPTDA